MRYVLDCSVAVRWFVPQPHAPRALALLELIRERKVEVIAPDVIVPEFGHVLRKLAVGRTIKHEQAQTFFDRFLDMNVPQVPSLPLSRAALRLALAHMGTFWDALYVALAVENDLEVVAADEPMTKAFAPLERTIHLANLEL